MTWFVNLSTRAKLLVGFGLVIFFLVCVIAAAYWGLETVRNAQQRLNDVEFADALDTLLIRNNENGLRGAMLTAALFRDPVEQGRGFGVVAQEVRNLAAQSKQAEIAARNLHEIGQKLTQLVAQYRI